jgi:hypothetical protein
MAHMWGEMTNLYRILVMKTKRKRPLGRPKGTYEDNIKIDLKKGVDWIHVTQDRYRWQALVNTVI